MADLDKNILITPNIGQTEDPSIVFTGGDTTNPISLSVLDTGTLSFSGSSGQLFSISDDLTGTIFSVNDISGIPSIEVIDDGTVLFAEYSGNVLIGTNTDNDLDKLQVQGNFKLSGDLTVTGAVNLEDNFILLNSDYVTVSPTENSGIIVNRGGDGANPNVSLRWNETDDAWEITNDGTEYSPIATLGDEPTKVDFTAVGGENDFTTDYNIDNVEVYVNGIKLRGYEYVATNGTLVTILDDCNEGDWVQIITNKDSNGVTFSYADDSDLLDGQHGTYYTSWNNTTSKPTTLGGYGIEAAIFSAVYDNGIKSSNWTFDPNNGQYQEVLINGDCTLAFTEPAGPCTVYLHIHQGTTGGIITFPTAKWSGAPKENTTTTDGHDLLMVHYYGNNLYVLELMLDLT